MNVKDARVELCVNEQDARHVIITVAFALFLLVRNPLLVLLLVLPIDQAKLLSTRAGEEGDHDVGGGRAEE